jgi:anhydro-N-acetylmuramic acid kinase
MSGTSLDGISAAVVRFPTGLGSASGGLPCELVAYATRPYSSDERQRLERAIHRGASTSEWCDLNFELGGWLADAANQVLERSGVPRAKVQAIASHGQTVWHEPGRSTWQIGEAAVIAERTGLDVVSDFRVRDVAAGGQGAPLVSMADLLLFASDREWRTLQNLGGIANLTIVPPARRARSKRALGAAREVDRDRVVRAFDTGPGMVVIDSVVRALRPDLPYDIDGALARQGKPIGGVLDALLADPYFAAPPPKTTGREHFSAEYVASFLARCRSAAPRATDADIVATAVALTVRSIADAYRRFVAEPVTQVLISGGGARNPVVVRELTRALAPRAVRAFDDVFFDGEAKEAVAFALLAALYLADRPGNVPSATGARGPRLLGKLTKYGGR